MVSHGTGLVHRPAAPHNCDVDEVLRQYFAISGFSRDQRELLQRVANTLGPHLDGIAGELFDRITGHPATSEVFEKLRVTREPFRPVFSAWIIHGLSNAGSLAYWERQVNDARHHAARAITEAEVFAGANGMSELLHRLLVQKVDDKETLIESMVAVDRWLELETAIMLRAIRSRAEAKARDKERLATIGQLAASMGHDLRNPLGVIQSSLFLLRRRLSDNERVVTHLDRMDNQVQLCNRIISDLLEMTRNRPLRLQQTPIAEVFAKACEAVQFPDHVDLHVEAADDLVAEVEPGLMVQCMMNLVQNAVLAVHDQPRGHVLVRADAVDAGVSIAVSDDGPGFPPDIIEQVFEPLVTTRPKGTGLGLALVRSVITRHGGEAVASNPERGGAMVTFVLPKKFSPES